MLNTASQPPRRCSHHPVACPPGLASPLDTSSLNIPATTFSSLSMLLQPASSFTYWRSVPTHFVGAALLRGEWRHVVSLILGTGVFYKWHGHVDAALRGMPGMLQWRELFGPTDSENQASFSFLHKKVCMKGRADQLKDSYIKTRFSGGANELYARNGKLRTRLPKSQLFRTNDQWSE
ncbi:hypothetical protein BDA96_10G245100 [Sorghum bicolor]|uniref:Uncharacterized protein n=1 Tax=Sorghum bicolor TaxID=4558 RepID=A0A921Q4A8_SORBI|nr:uncharacterized protein LOC110430734 isoform X3 [Sorghum bicolor]KAG0515043.1 hypothetical protein BDA96_10G245100 [Sorghum bicolor]|eukprot:XP_021304282.1 uncharacterized protein LOC110430734 isoform X3 [Sorghum bicolor]